MEKPFPAYQGDEPYIFVCYAHDDSDVVYPEMDFLRDQGLNVWYDEGISAGANWRAAIGDSLLGASHVLFYISKHSLQSDHCNREINLALDEVKDVVPVYLEEIELTSDLKVGLNRVQALHRDDDVRYRQHLLNALGRPDAVPQPLQSVPKRPGRRTIQIGTAVAILVVAVWWYWQGAPPPSGTAEGSPLPAIAVLPFVNMSSDPEQEYFSDGIAEELLNVLAKIDGLKVAARTSSFSFKGQNKPVAEIAEVLGVGYILEGSVRKSGTQIRITAQLIRISDGFYMWSETYDRELVNILAIQDEIAEAIVDELRVRLTNQTQIASASTGNAEAYQEYLQGRYFWNLRTTQNLYRAAEHFDRATKIDPTYTDAWLGMAETWVVLPGYELNDAKALDHFEQARKAARSALSLLPRSGRAHAVLGYAHIVRLEWRESVVSFELALQYEPGNATAWQWYGTLLGHIGRHEESAAAFEKALELDPLSRVIGTNAAEFLAAAGNYDAALEQITRTITSAPDFGYALRILGFNHLMRHEFDDARATFRRLSELEGIDAARSARRMVFVDRAETFAQTGERVELSKFDKEEFYFDRDLHTLALVCIGQYEAALDIVEQYSGTNYARSSVYFLRSVLFQEVMGDNPRYQKLVQRLATFEGGND